MVRRVESGNTDTGPGSQCYTVTESEWPLQTAASGERRPAELRGAESGLGVITTSRREEQHGQWSDVASDGVLILIVLIWSEAVCVCAGPGSEE